MAGQPNIWNARHAYSIIHYATPIVKFPAKG